MLKMYSAEVLGKFPVVQHFPFGSIFTWEAAGTESSDLKAFHAIGSTPSDKPVEAPTSTASVTGLPTATAPWLTQPPLPPSASRPPSKQISVYPQETIQVPVPGGYAPTVA